MAITVDELLETPFCERPREEQVRILSGNRPRPFIQMTIKRQNNLLSHKKFHSKESIYDKISWLTGCEKRHKLFCWPCLLFMPAARSISGISDLRFVIDGYEEHQRDPQHLKAFLKFQSLKQEILPDVGVRNRVEFHSSSSLIYLIDAICSVIKGTTSNNDKYKGNVVEVNQCITYLKRLRTNTYAVDETMRLLHKSPEIITDFVNCIASMIKTTIVDEIQKSTFVSIILSEHVINKEKSQISTVLRYLKDGKVNERFIGFINSVGFRQRRENIAKHILNVTKEYNFEEKFLALSVDGAVLCASQLSELLQLSEFRDIHFVPCYFHGFGRVLIQSVAHSQGCGLFFKMLNAMESYFDHEQNYSEFEKSLQLRVQQFKTNFRSNCPFLVCLNMYRKYFIVYFNTLLTLPQYLPPDDVVKISEFKAFLEDIKFVYLLKLFNKLFQHNLDKNTNIARDEEGNEFDNARFVGLHCYAAKLQKDLQQENFSSASSFNTLWIETTMEMTGCAAPLPEKLKCPTPVFRVCYPNTSPKIVLPDFHQEIIHQIAKETEFRVKGLAKLVFCELLRWRVSTFKGRQRLVNLLLSEKRLNMDSETLDSEVTVLRGKIDKIVLCNKSLYDLMATFHEYNLHGVFPCLYRFAEFILTLPYLPPFDNFNYKTTKLKQIDSYSYMPLVTGTLSDETSILCTEKSMLQDLQCSNHFHSDLIKRYREMKTDGGFE